MPDGCIEGPGESPIAAEEWLGIVRDEVESRPSLIAEIGLNEFELERLAPLASSRALKVVGEWPWSSVLEDRPEPGSSSVVAVPSRNDGRSPRSTR